MVMLSWRAREVPVTGGRTFNVSCGKTKFVPGLDHAGLEVKPVDGFFGQRNDHAAAFRCHGICIVGGVEN